MEPSKIVLTPEERMEYDQYPKEIFTPTLYKTYFALPMQVNYVVESVPIPHFTHPDTPKLHILCTLYCRISNSIAELISSNVLLKEIREKGGAYGGGSRISADGVFHFYSYRDPHTLATYQAFEKGIQWATNGEMRYHYFLQLEIL
jgi:Predicted Zn-dependent peptidases, insulinase-like